MRIGIAGFALYGASFLALLGLGVVPPAAAQNPDTLMPEQSAAKAHEILGRMIEALGGPAYLKVRESECSGRLSQFGHNGDLTGYLEFHDYWHFPDKNRTDYGKKGNIIDMFAGDRGWTVDRSGVSDQTSIAVTDFQEQTKRDVENLLRFRMKEDGLVFRYGGTDIVDRKQVDWIEIADREERTFRLAVERGSNLFVRSEVITRDDTTRERAEEMTFYSNYHPQDGVQTALQVTRERDGRRVYQAFFESCKYNPGFAEDFFTKEALEKRYSEVYSKKDQEKARREREKN